MYILVKDNERPDRYRQVSQSEAIAILKGQDPRPDEDTPEVLEVRAAIEDMEEDCPDGVTQRPTHNDK